MTRGTRAALALALGVAACAPAPTRALPGASLAPRLSARITSTHACGDDIALDGHDAPDVRYSYAFDALGRLAGATGDYAAGGAPDTITYAYDNLGNQTQFVETNGPGSCRVELDYDYDTLGDLADYTYAVSSPSGSDTQQLAMSEFTAAARPQIEVITDGGYAAHYTLAYDDQARLTRTVRDAISVTTYTYDDDARTLVVDTDDGAYHGEIDYDDDARELAETWGGSASDAQHSRTAYRYAGQQLLAVSYEIGAPLAVVEVDTLRYCQSLP